MEQYFSKQTLDTIIVFYLVFIITIIVYIHGRLKKSKRLAIKQGTKLPIWGTTLQLIIVGILAFFFVFILSYIEFQLIWMIGVIITGIKMASLARRTCSYCKKNIKDEAIVCPYCQSNISDSVITEQ